MALAKNEIFIPLTGGIDTLADDRILSAPKFSYIENISFQRTGVLKKRSGKTKLVTRNEREEEIITSSIAILNDELCLITSDGLYSGNNNSQIFKKRGDVSLVSNHCESLLADQSQHYHSCSARTNNRLAVVCHTTKNIIVNIYNTNDNALITSKTIENCISPLILNDEYTFFIFCLNNNHINLLTFNTKKDTYSNLIDIPVDIVNLDTSSTIPQASYHVLFVSDKLILFARTKLGITAFYINKLGVIMNNFDVGYPNSYEFNVANIMCFSVCHSHSDKIIFLTIVHFDEVVNEATKIFIKIISMTYQLQRLHEINEKLDSLNVFVNTVVHKSMINVFVTHTSYSAISTIIHTRKLEYNTELKLLSDRIVNHDLVIVTQFFEHQEMLYFIAVSISSLQPTYFLCDINGNIKTMFLEYQALSPSANYITHIRRHVAPVHTLKDNHYFTVLESIAHVYSENNQLKNIYGLSSVTLSFNEPVSQYVQYQNSIYFTGGFLYKYDGEIVSEVNFLTYPDDFRLKLTAGEGLSIGSYQYCVVYQYLSNKGVLSISAPSIAKTITVTDSKKANVQIAIYDNVLTLRPDNSDIRIIIYRTECNGTTFYRCINYDQKLEFKKSHAIYVDSLKDNDLISRDMIYTTGNVLDNFPAPQCSIIVMYQNRMIISGLANTNEIRYSKTLRSTHEPAFNPYLTFTVDQTIGKVTALYVMDEKLIIFKSSSIFFIVGGFASDIGEMQQPIQPLMISSSIGTYNNRTIATIPDGIIFASESGIYLLSRGLQLQNIGYPVHLFLTDSFICFVTNAEQNEVRCCQRDRILVYNYLHSQWSIFTQYEQIIDSNLYKNKQLYLTKPSTLYIDQSLSIDDQSMINSIIETGWFSFNSVQGYQRIYKFIILGKFSTKDKVSIDLKFDYEDSYTEFHILQNGKVKSQANSNEDQLIDERIFYQVEIFPIRQKCESMKMRITGISTTTETYEINGVSFIVGTKQGLHRMKRGL